MKLFHEYSFIAICSNCGVRLHYLPSTNIYSGGPFECGNCKHDVTDDIYGKKEIKKDTTYKK